VYISDIGSGAILERQLAALAVDVGRSSKPRADGLTMVLDTGLGVAEITSACALAGRWWDYAKLAWGSALITAGIAEKLDTYRRFDVLPFFGGTLFEYAYLHGRVETLLSVAREHDLHVEISDGVVNVPRADKLRWIERFAAHVEVFSEIGGKTYQVSAPWRTLIAEDRAAGATKIVIEGREIGPPGQDFRADLLEELLDAAPRSTLIFEALERAQQVWLVKRLGPNVNLGNIRPADVITLESFRQGLKEHTLLEASAWHTR
jgi:phosphosulfolactate synthase